MCVQQKTFKEFKDKKQQSVERRIELVKDYQLRDEVNLTDIRTAILLRRRVFQGQDLVGKEIVDFIELRTPKARLYEQIGFNVAWMWMTSKRWTVNNKKQVLSARLAEFHSWMDAETNLMRMRFKTITDVDVTRQLFEHICGVQEVKQQQLCSVLICFTVSDRLHYKRPTSCL